VPPPKQPLPLRRPARQALLFSRHRGVSRAPTRSPEHETAAHMRDFDCSAGASVGMSRRQSRTNLLDCPSSPRSVPAGCLVQLTSAADWNSALETRSPVELVHRASSDISWMHPTNKSFAELQEIPAISSRRLPIRNHGKEAQPLRATRRPVRRVRSPTPGKTQHRS
jgi:hypothetical protein